MSDGSSKALRVDEGQTVGDVLEVLMEKTHCDGSVDWSLTETHHQLQTGERSGGTRPRWLGRSCKGLSLKLHSSGRYSNMFAVSNVSSPEEPDQCS